MPDPTLLQRLKDRLIIQWGLAYVAGAWLILEVLGHAGETFGWPAAVDQVALIVAGVGFFLVLVLAWYHGEQGRQRVSGAELLIIGLLLVVCGGVLSVFRGRGEEASDVSAETSSQTGAVSEGETSAELVPNRVFVTLFENQTGDSTLDPAGRMASDFIIRDLMSTGVMEVLPLDLAIAVAEDGGEAGPGRRSSQDVAHQAGAAFLVSGSFFAQGDSLVVQGQVTNVEEGQLQTALGPVNASRQEPAQGFAELARRASGALAVLVDPGFAQAFAGYVPPVSYAAYAEFAAGADAFSHNDFVGATERFTRAAELDSTWLSPLGMKSVALWNRGMRQEADSVRLLAERFRDRANSMERANLDIQAGWFGGDREAAYRAAERAAGFDPGGNMAFQFGYEAIKTNRLGKAVEILEAMDPTRPDMAPWISYWNRLTSAYHMLGEFQKELDTAVRARALHPDSPFPALHDARALIGLGRIDEAFEAVNEYRNRQGTQASVRGLALELRAHGHPEAAMEVLNEVLGWYEGQPNDPETQAGLRAGKAETLYYLERWEEAGSIFADLASVDPDSYPYLGFLGALAARRGDREEALRLSEELAALDRPYLFGANTYRQARIAALLGEFDRAVVLLRQAHGEGRSYGVAIHRDPDLESLRGHPAFEEFMRPRG